MSRVQRDLTLSLKMADSPILKQWVLNEENEVLKSQALEELESYRASFEGKSLFLASNQSGHYYFSDGSDDQFGVPRYTLDRGDQNDAWYFRALRDTDSFELNVDYDNHLDVNKIWFNVVIRDFQNNKIGLGGSGIDISRFVNEFIDSNDEGVETIFFSKDGAIEGHRDRQYVIHNSKVRGDEKKFTIFDLMDDDSEKVSVQKMLDKLLSGQTEVESGWLSVQGKRRLGAISYMEEIRWFNLVLLDANKVVEIDKFIPVLAILILSLLAVVVIIGYLVNRLVLRRLMALSVSSNQIALGNFDISMPVHSDDEIGGLTDAFNYMARMVKDHSENLEHKVVQRTEQLKQLNEKLEESNRRVMDSIHYAELIQASILPSADAVQNRLPEFFAIYRPRDIVGGDSYFYREYPDGCYIAVIDCTGHGVPGAFMSMTANAVLNYVLESAVDRDPAAILGELNRRMRVTLHQHTEHSSIDNGLDIGLCWCPFDQESLLFAGARIDMLLFKGEEVSTAFGQRESLGYRQSEDNSFQNQRVLVSEGVNVYLFTDGILDQSGGAKGWGFGRRRLRELLTSVSGLPGQIQKERIEAGLRDYQGSCRQRDDITLIGFRIAGFKD